MNYRLMVQARYAAEAGVQATANWILHGYPQLQNMTACNSNATNAPCYKLTTRPVQYVEVRGSAGLPVVLSAISTGPNCSSSPTAAAGTPCYSVPQVEDSFYSALNNQTLPGVPYPRYSTYATLMSMTPITLIGAMVTTTYAQSWQITSEGSIVGVRNSQIQVVQMMEVKGTPPFTYAVQGVGTGPNMGCPNVSLGVATVDAYNSLAGPYGGPNVIATGANVESNYGVSLGNSTVDGVIAEPASYAGTGLPGWGIAAIA